MADLKLIINARQRTVRLGDISVPCRIGRDGFVDGVLGREGDEKTPLGDYYLRFGLYRPDRLPAPKSNLTIWAMHKDDGWCDDPEDPAYNRLIRLPYPAKNHQVSHEPLWREDGVYDIVLVISHNDNPPEPGHGSAVFIHVAQSDDRQTLGCVAFAPDDMIRLLPHLKTGLQVLIEA